MAMSVAMMVIVGMVNVTMYIIVFGLCPCKVKVKAVSDMHVSLRTFSVFSGGPKSQDG